MLCRQSEHAEVVPTRRCRWFGHRWIPGSVHHGRARFYVGVRIVRSAECLHARRCARCGLEEWHAGSWKPWTGPSATIRPSDWLKA
jgi:hypothetical protein